MAADGLFQSVPTRNLAVPFWWITPSAEPSGGVESLGSMNRPRNRLAMLSALALITGLTVGNLGAQTAAAARVLGHIASPAAQWTDVSTFPQASGGFGEVSCASSTCAAVGFVSAMSLDVSHDGGRSWVSPPIPPGVSTLESVSCPSRLECLAVGEYMQPAPTDTRLGVVVMTPDGRTTWAKVTTTDIGSLEAVSCPSVSRCVAIGYVDLHGDGSGSFAMTTATAGKSWASVKLPRSELQLTDLACPTVSSCVAVGSDTAADGSTAPVVEVTTDGGHHWKPAILPGQNMALDAVSCPTASNCVATGADQPPSNDQGVSTSVPVVFTSADGGERWAQQARPPGGDYIGTVSCLANGRCLATGADVPRVSRDFGETWTLAAGSEGFDANVTSIACITNSNCVAVGGSEGPSNGAYSFPFATPTLATSSDGGLLWAPRSPPRGWSIEGMYCPGMRTCVAVGTTNAGTAGAWASNDLGATWAQSSLTTPVQVLNSVACPSPLICTAVGSASNGTAVALTTGDGGDTWRASSLPKGLASLASVSCSNRELCVAVGSLAVHITVPPGGHIGVGDIESGGGALITSDNGGKAWVDRTHSATNAGYVPYFFSVACLPDLFCATGPSYGRFLSSVNGGETWTDVKNSSQYFPTSGLSCVDQTRCAAYATDQGSPPQLYWTSDGGHSWSPARFTSVPTQYAGSTWQFGGIQCLAQGLCIAVGGDAWYGDQGLALLSRDSGRTWATTNLPRAATQLTALACTPGGTTCVASSESPTGRGLFLEINLVPAD